MSASAILSRREAMQLAAAGVVGFSSSGWLEALAQRAATNPQRRRSCILLWMNGGPSQMDTFDLKPGHANGGPFQEIETTVPGIRISEHLPSIATHMDKMAIIRSMSTQEGDHGRGTFYLRTGYLPQGPIQYPTLGSLVSQGARRRPICRCRTSSASRRIALQPGGVFVRLPRPAVRPARRRRSHQLRLQPERDAGCLRSKPPRAGPATARRGSSDQVDARVDLLQDMERDFVARHQRSPLAATRPPTSGPSA